MKAGSHGVFSFDNPSYQRLINRSGSADGFNRPRSRSKFSFEPRYQIVFACFLATLTAYVERTGFSIAYTAMAKDAAVDEAIKGTVLSSFYWGYGVSQIPGGWAAQRFGGDITLTMSFILWSLASILTPGNASNTHSIIVARVCVGISQGFIIPAIHTVLSKWIPPTERARAVSLTTSGMYLGSATAMQLFPKVAASFGASFLLKFVGLLGLSWVILWRTTLHRVRTAKHMQTMPMSDGGHGSKKNANYATIGKYDKVGPIPWRRMVTHRAVWAIVINNFTFHYAFYVVMNWLPTYFDKILDANIASLGLVKTLPYLTMFAASNAGGWAGDYLITVGKKSVAEGRKAVNTAGFWTASAALLLMPGASTVGAGVMYTTIALGACGFSRGGFSVNHMDIAPKYAGMVM
jgi:ACS family sodium-dependent inorganic phosphate cotransporter